MIQFLQLAIPCRSAPSSLGRLDWETDGRDWPDRQASRFVRGGGLTWHVQIFGQGPAILLVHGTGASTHSWRALTAKLATRFTVIAPDLPGHGFTEMPGPELLSLPGMAQALEGLLAALEVRPTLVVGHSAGAAILARMCLSGQIAPDALVSLNGAFLPLRGGQRQLFSPIAKLFVALPPVPWLFSHFAGSPGAVERVIDGTGSSLDRDGIELYRRLVTSPGHVAATLGMMANWELEPLERDLGRLQTRLILVVGEADRTISPSEAERIRSIAPNARIISLPGLGHLAHEEAPEAVVALIEGVTEA